MPFTFMAPVWSLIGLPIALSRISWSSTPTAHPHSICSSITQRQKSILTNWICCYVFLSKRRKHKIRQIQTNIQTRWVFSEKHVKKKKERGKANRTLTAENWWVLQRLDIEQKIISWAGHSFPQIELECLFKYTLSRLIKQLVLNHKGVDWALQIPGDQAETQRLQSLTGHKIPAERNHKPQAGSRLWLREGIFAKADVAFLNN